MSDELRVIRARWWHRILASHGARVVGINDVGTAEIEVWPRYWHPAFWWWAVMALLGRGPEFIEMEAASDE